MAGSVKVVVGEGTGPAPGPEAGGPGPGPRPAEPVAPPATVTCARGPGLLTAAATGDDPDQGQDNPRKQHHQCGRRKQLYNLFKYHCTKKCNMICAYFVNINFFNTFSC